MITAAAAASRENARRPDGKFGEQAHPEAGTHGQLGLSEPQLRPADLYRPAPSGDTDRLDELPDHDAATVALASRTVDPVLARQLVDQLPKHDDTERLTLTAELGRAQLLESFFNDRGAEAAAEAVDLRDEVGADLLGGLQPDSFRDEDGGVDFDAMADAAADLWSVEGQRRWRRALEVEGSRPDRIDRIDRAAERARLGMPDDRDRLAWNVYDARAAGCCAEAVARTVGRFEVDRETMACEDADEFALSARADDDALAVSREAVRQGIVPRSREESFAEAAHTAAMHPARDVGLFKIGEHYIAAPLTAGRNPVAVRRDGRFELR